MDTMRKLLQCLAIVAAGLCQTGCGDATSPAEDGSVTTCSTDEDCPGDQLCIGGVCQADDRDGGADGEADAGIDAGGDAADAGGDEGGDLAADEDTAEPDIEITVPAPTGSPPVHQLEFGNVMVGVTTSQQAVLANVGEADLRILQFNFEAGPGAADFSIPQELLDALPIVVEPGKDTRVDIIYTASDGLTDHAVLDVISNDPDEPLVKIHLLSEFKGEPLVSVQPQSLDFGTVSIGARSRSQVVTVANQGTGNAVLTVEDIRLGVLANPDFSFSVTDPGGQAVEPPALLNNGDFLEAAVVYHPQVSEPDSDELVIVTDDPTHETISVTLSGEGIYGILEIVPESVDLGQVLVGESEMAFVSLENSGDVSLYLTGVSLADGSAAWSVTSDDLNLAALPATPYELTAGETVIVTVHFDALAVGEETAALVVDNTTEEPQRTVPLRAEGICPGGNANCDGDPSNGCECSFEHAAATCDAGACVMGACEPGYHDIDADDTNGCECASADDVASLCDDALIEDLGILADGNQWTVSGNLVPELDEDWYTFIAPDDNDQDALEGHDDYHLHVAFDPAGGNPDGEFVFNLYRKEQINLTCAQKGTPICVAEDTEYNRIHDCVDNPEPDLCRAEGVTTSAGPCLCHDNTAKYWLQVVRAADQPVTCNGYTLVVSFTE